MATLISPGVSVTVIDESFFIPATAPTVPLFFILTEDNKLTPDGTETAAGTQESGIIRTITSATQLSDLYGVPVFRTTAGIARDGLFTNEYGLWAANTFLGVGNFCYVVRADQNLASTTEDAAGLSAVLSALNAEITSTTSGVLSEFFEYNLILAPYFGYIDFDGSASGTVATNLIALSNNLNNEAFVIFDGPHEKTPEDFATEAGSFPKSVYSAVYYPGGIATNLDGEEIFVPASAIAIRVIARSDRSSEVWFAPAGFRRGIVDNVSKVGYIASASATTGEGTFTEVDLSNGQRDVLYADGKNVNPITRFPGRGIAVFGQKTQASTTSALDRINVSRLLVAIRRSIRKGALSFVFEPNDQITRDNLRVSIEGFLGDILTRRGLFDFAVVSDETNNTPTRIDRNELYVDIALKPTKAAEFIFIPIRVLNTGANLSAV
jgi:phage tail sheath protein FI